MPSFLCQRWTGTHGRNPFLIITKFGIYHRQFEHSSCGARFCTILQFLMVPELIHEHQRAFRQIREYCLRAVIFQNSTLHCFSLKNCIQKTEYSSSWELGMQFRSIIMSQERAFYKKGNQDSSMQRRNFQNFDITLVNNQGFSPLNTI